MKDIFSFVSEAVSNYEEKIGQVKLWAWKNYDKFVFGKIIEHNLTLDETSLLGFHKKQKIENF